MKLAPLFVVLAAAPAWAQVGGGEINMPPGKITTLAASTIAPTTIRLTWTAVGPDGTLGGTCSSYQIRRHGVPITTAALWTAATVVPQALVPKPAGSLETFDVTGLPTETSYYFCVRAVDPEGQLGTFSNAAGASTPDITPPPDVRDLAVSGTTLSSAILT